MVTALFINILRAAQSIWNFWREEGESHGAAAGAYNSGFAEMRSSAEAETPPTELKVSEYRLHSHNAGTVGSFSNKPLSPKISPTPRRRVGRRLRSCNRQATSATGGHPRGTCRAPRRQSDSFFFSCWRRVIGRVAQCRPRRPRTLSAQRGPRAPPSASAPSAAQRSAGPRRARTRSGNSPKRPVTRGNGVMVTGRTGGTLTAATHHSLLPPNATSACYLHLRMLPPHATPDVGIATPDAIFPTSDGTTQSTRRDTVVTTWAGQCARTCRLAPDRVSSAPSSALPYSAAPSSASPSWAFSQASCSTAACEMNVLMAGEGQGTCSCRSATTRRTPPRRATRPVRHPLPCGCSRSQGGGARSARGSPARPHRTRRTSRHHTRVRIRRTSRRMSSTR